MIFRKSAIQDINWIALFFSYDMIIKKHLIGLMKMKQGIEGLIQNTEELEFVIFCIESVAAKTKMDAEEVYDLLAKKTNILAHDLSRIIFTFL